MTAQPIIICGRAEQTATGIIEHLKPEFEVIHLVLSVEAGVAQIPLLLSGKEAPSDTALGTKNYSQPPQFIVIGRGYDDAAIEEMRKSCEGDDIKKVPWLRADMSVPAPPLGPEYGKALVQRIKKAVADVQKDGSQKGDEIVWY